MLDRIILVMLALGARVAHADHHDMGPMPAEDDGPSAFGAGIGLVAASFATPDYVGNYQGVVPAATWQTWRLTLGASLPMYRLEKNGLETFGLGDALAHAALALWDHQAFHTGVTAAVTAPTGDPSAGFGMGHAMVMPALWGAWGQDRVVASASVGFGRALGVGNCSPGQNGAACFFTGLFGMSTVHDHGPWPLVEPMNMSEITWSAAVDIVLDGGLHGGVRASGGVPAGAPGHDRAIGAARLAWGSPRFETAAELQAGLVGDPFTLRGLLETALHF